MTQHVFATMVLGTGIRLVAYWTHDEAGLPVTVANMTCAHTGADAGQVIYQGHLRSEFVVCTAAQVNRAAAVTAAAPPEPEPLPFDLFSPPHL